MVVKSFEEFVKEGIAKRITPDKQRAENLYLEAERKFTRLLEIIKNMGIDNDGANDYLEYCYNAMMFLIRAKMLDRGYSSAGPGAHAAEVAFARILGLPESELRLLDELRYFRNGILYYGKRFDKEYALRIIEVTKKIFKRLQ